MPFGALGAIPDVVESTDPKTFESGIAASFAAQLLVNPASQLIEIAVAGGGAGGVYQATIYYSTQESGNFPPLIDQHVKVVWGSDPRTVLDKLAEFYATVAVDRTTFVEKVAAGAGIQWLDVVIYTLGEDLALAEFVDVDEVTARTFAVEPAVPSDGSSIVAAEYRAQRLARRKAKKGK